MTNLRSTVVLKTDICGFTTQVQKLEKSELTDLLERHKHLISNIALKQAGSLIKGEGDSFWLIFPSVTTAALAGVEMQQELRVTQLGKSDEQRLKIRIAITLGDILHLDRDIFGDAVNLAARIENITPPDEIYLSQAAWLALNKAEVQSAFVGEFSLKGISQPEKVYYIQQRHKTRHIHKQIIVKNDIKRFTNYQESHSTVEVENLLTHLDNIQKRVCSQFGATIRLIVGDSYLLTFTQSDLALKAVQQLCYEWSQFINKHQIDCGLAVGMTRGDLKIFQSCIYGRDINIASRLEAIGRIVKPQHHENSVIVDEKIYADLKENSLHLQLQKVDKAFILDKLLDHRPKDYFMCHDIYLLLD
jgi:class 3 adenylate cyclase